MLFRSIAWLTARTFALVFFVAWVIFLVADVGDRLKLFMAHSAEDLVALYVNKALVAALQVGPLALLLAGGLSYSSLARRGELGAAQSLGASPRRLLAPAAAVALVVALGWSLFDEFVVTSAGQRVDELSVTRFQSWGDWRHYYTPKRWFRAGDHLVRVGQYGSDGALEEVSLLLMDSAFTVTERWDAKVMRHVAGTRWALEDVTVRRSSDALNPSSQHHPSVQRELPGSFAEAFADVRGRPEWMRSKDLMRQAALRKRLGVSAEHVVWALHNRWAFPLGGALALLLTASLVFKVRAAQATVVALTQGLAVSVALWVCTFLGKTAALSARWPPAWAAWFPCVVLLFGVGALWVWPMPKTRA